MHQRVPQTWVIGASASLWAKSTKSRFCSNWGLWLRNLPTFCPCSSSVTWILASLLECSLSPACLLASATWCKPGDLWKHLPASLIDILHMPCASSLDYILSPWYPSTLSPASPPPEKLSRAQVIPCLSLSYGHTVYLMIPLSSKILIL